jgi:hypothetical protein
MSEYARRSTCCTSGIDQRQEQREGLGLMSLILHPAGLTVIDSEHAIKHLEFSEAQHNMKQNRLEERFGSEAHKVSL